TAAASSAAASPIVAFCIFCILQVYHGDGRCARTAEAGVSATSAGARDLAVPLLRSPSRWYTGVHEPRHEARNSGDLPTVLCIRGAHLGAPGEARQGWARLRPQSHMFSKRRGSNSRLCLCTRRFFAVGPQRAARTEASKRRGSHHAE